MRFFKSTGDVGQDAQWDHTEKRLARLEALQGHATSNPAPTQRVVVSGQSGLTVQQSDGTNSVIACGVLQADLAAGFAVVSATPYATISRTANVIVPLANSGTGAAGTSIISANQDHVHPQTGSRLLYSNITVPGGNTITNTLAATAFTSTFTLAANSLVAGQQIRLRIFGLYGTSIVAPNVTLAVKLGATAVGTTGAITTIASVTAAG